MEWAFIIPLVAALILMNEKRHEANETKTEITREGKNDR